jgi:hypothetical protein
MLFAMQVGSFTEGATAGICGTEINSFVNIKMHVPVTHVVMFGSAVPGRYDCPLFVI